MNFWPETVFVQMYKATKKHHMIWNTWLIITCLRCWLTSLSNGSPPGHPAVLPTVEHTLSGCQTDWPYEVSEGNWGAEPQQSNVIVVSSLIVSRVQDDPRHSSGHLIRIASLLGSTAKVNNQASGSCALNVRMRSGVIPKTTAFHKYGSTVYKCLEWVIYTRDDYRITKHV